MSTPPPSQPNPNPSHAEIPQYPCCMFERRPALLDPHRCSVRTQKRILILATSETTVIRLAELIEAAVSDWRVQIAFTIPIPRARNSVNLEQTIQRHHLPFVPWDLAVAESFDLAIVASTLEERPELDIPLLMLCHGPGRTKTISLPQRSKNHRNWLIDRKNPSSRRIIGAVNQAEADFFGANCETFVLGDPVFDSLLNSLHRKNEFKSALRVGKRKLIVVSSTWHDDSLIGSLPELLETLLAKYPYDEYAFALVLHHAVWNAHPEWQIKTWLREPLRSGLILVNPEKSWQAAIVAADMFIGDYGSVSLYANLLNSPCCFVNLPEGGLNQEYAIVQATNYASHARGIEDIERFIDNPPTKPMEQIEEAREESFANLGCSIQALSEKIFGLIGLDCNKSACTPIRLATPQAYQEEPRSWLIAFNKVSEGKYSIDRYPACTQSAKGASLLIASSNETDHRILASSSGVVLRTPDARSWWTEVAPFAQLALECTRGLYRVIDRTNNEITRLQADAAPERVLGAIILSRQLGRPVEVCQDAGTTFCASAQLH